MDRTDHFLSIADWSAEALQETLALAHRLKADPAGQGRPLAGKTLAMVFAKSSTRTRVSFEVGTYQLGGHALFLSSRDIQLGRGEPIADTSRVLSRYVDGVMIRTFAQSDVEDFARAGTVPVVNGLTDLLHPCQLMADVMTIQESPGSRWPGSATATTWPTPGSTRPGDSDSPCAWPVRKAIIPIPASSSPLWRTE
jgi:ornithine carbamoyltransferase